MAGDIIKEFLVSIGYKLDEASTTKVEAAIKKLEKTLVDSEKRKITEEIKAADRRKDIVRNAVLQARLLGDTLEGVARQSIQSITAVTSGFEEIFYASRRIGMSVGDLKSFTFAMGQMGSSTGAAMGSLESLASKMRRNPGYKYLLESLGVPGGELTEKGMEALGKRLSKMPTYMQYQWADRLGIDDNTLRALMQGIGRFGDEYKRKMKAAGLNPESAAKDAKEFNNSLRSMYASVEVVWSKLMTALIQRPAGGGKNIMENITDAIDKFAKELDRGTVQDTINGIVNAVNQLGRSIPAIAQGFASIVSSLSKIADFMDRWTGRPSATEKAKPSHIFGFDLGRTAHRIFGWDPFDPHNAGNLNNYDVLHRPHPASRLRLHGIPGLYDVKPPTPSPTHSAIGPFGASRPSTPGKGGPGRAPTGLADWRIHMQELGVDTAGKTQFSVSVQRAAQAIGQFTRVAQNLSDSLLRVLYKYDTATPAAASELPAGFASRGVAAARALTPSEAAAPWAGRMRHNRESRAKKAGPAGISGGPFSSDTLMSSLTPAQQQALIDYQTKSIENVDPSRNNPGGIRYGDVAKRFGAIGQSKTGIALFPTLEAGRAAQRYSLFRVPGETIGQMVHRYAPASDNNDEPKYVRGLVGALNSMSPGAGGNKVVGGANLFSSGEFTKQTGIPAQVGGNLVQVTTAGGHTFTVNRWSAPAFKGFVEALEKRGYVFKPQGGLPPVQGYNPRSKFGSGGASEHAFGNAIDINPSANPFTHGNLPFGLGLKSDMPADISELAAKYGLSWGGDWHSVKDPMHFEWRGNPLQEKIKKLRNFLSRPHHKATTGPNDLNDDWAGEHRKAMIARGELTDQWVHSRNWDTLHRPHVRHTPAATGALGGHHISSDTKITVMGATEPHEVAKMVASNQKRVNIDLLRNLQGAIQ